MRTPLKKFTEFTNSLLPNETAYLLSVQRFEDKERLNILHRIDYNVHHIEQFTPYDIHINKRKYNHLQNWITARLKAIDVDEQFNQLLDWEQKIITDSIQATEEKELLSAIRKYEYPTFFFYKFYELVENYRHFLLIRLRYADCQLADNFLQKYQATYLQSREVKEKLYEASLAIVGQYSGRGGESKQWEAWLSEIFFNEKLEGQIRYLALVRLVFISHNYQKYDLLRVKFDYLDKKLAQGFYYSKRLLANYYNSRLMLHSHFKEYDRAVYYGYLSVRTNTHDYILYANNLCAVLLRLSRYQEALQMMRTAFNEAKKTKNFHNKIGYIAFYMKTLYKNGLQKNAEQYGDTFLKVYAKEILQYRWHLYFTVYFEILFIRQNFEKILKTARKYRLREKDKIYKLNVNYTPIIPLYIEAAQWAEGNISQTEFFETLDAILLSYDFRRNTTFREVLEGLKIWFPEISKRLTMRNG